MSNSLWSHGLQHTRLPCPSPTPVACSDAIEFECSSSGWWQQSVVVLILQGIWPCNCKSPHIDNDGRKGYKPSFLSKMPALPSRSLRGSERWVRISRWKDAVYRAQSAKRELGDSNQGCPNCSDNPCIASALILSLWGLTFAADHSASWCAAVHGIAKAWTRLSDWTTTLLPAVRLPLSLISRLEKKLNQNFQSNKLDWTKKKKKEQQ